MFECLLRQLKVWLDWFGLPTSPLLLTQWVFSSPPSLPHAVSSQLLLRLFAVSFSLVASLSPVPSVFFAPTVEVKGWSCMHPSHMGANLPSFFPRGV